MANSIIIISKALDELKETIWHYSAEVEEIVAKLFNSKEETDSVQVEFYSKEMDTVNIVGKHFEDCLEIESYEDDYDLYSDVPVELAVEVLSDYFDSYKIVDN